MQYVVGFVYSPFQQRVLLLRKNQPAWQAGHLNGVGGKIEQGETPHEAMSREWAEETHNARELGWDHFLTLQSGEHTIYFFRAVMAVEEMQMLDGTYNDVGEQFAVRGIFAFRTLPHIPNLAWIVPLGAYTHDRYRPLQVIENNPRGES